MDTPKCAGCGSTDVNDDWMTFDIEASPGARNDHKYSIVTTITHGFILCGMCYLSPAAGILRNAVSDEYATVAPKAYGCITLCSKPFKDRRGHRHVRRKKALCPGCMGNTRVYQIYRDETPGIVARLAYALYDWKEDRNGMETRKGRKSKSRNKMGGNRNLGESRPGNMDKSIGA